MQPQQAIQGTPIQPPVYSLLGVAPQTVLPDADWLAGFRWSPETTQAGAMGVVRADCIGDTSAGLGAVARAGFGQGDPFVVWYTDQCSTMGYRAADYAGRAARGLAAVQSYQVAKELWAGAVSSPAVALGNMWLANTVSDELTTAGVSPLDALGRLEEGIAFYGNGRRGMIHCTPQVLVSWQQTQVLRFTNGVWLSPMGNIIVADAGYPGTSPTGGAPAATQWAYATEVIEFVLSDPMMLPAWDPTTQEDRFFGEALDRTVNKMIVYAQRFAAWKWDRQIHVAAEITLQWPTFGGA